MKKTLILTAALLCGAAHAEFYDGNDLYGKLTADNSIDNMVGLGYIMGVFDSSRGVTHCPPDNVRAGQIRDMVRQHLEALPSVRNITADVQVRFVLQRAWPCAKKNGGAL